MNNKNFYCSLVLCVFTYWLQAQSPGGVDWLSTPGTQGQVTKTTYTNGSPYSSILNMIEKVPSATTTSEDPTVVFDTTTNMNNSSVFPANTGFRFEFYIFTPVQGNYRFKVCSDDGSRVTIYDDELIDNDNTQPINCVSSGTYFLTSNTYHPVVVDFYQGSGNAGLHLEWDVPGGGVTYTTIPASQIYARNPGVGAGLWLKADDISQANNTIVNTWADASPFGNNATGKGVKPDFYTNRVNFNPAVQFDDGGAGSAEWFELPSIFGTAHHSDADVFVVFNTDDGDDNPLVHEDHENGDFYMDVDNGEVRAQGRQNEKKDNHTGNNQFMLWSSHMHNSTNASRNPHSQKLSLYENGDRVAQGNNTVSFQGEDNIMYIGSDDGPNEHQGDIAEVVIYTKPLTNNERIRVNSYLAIKYGLTLSHNYLSSDGTNIWDRNTTVSNSGDNYNNDIAGIGRDNNSDLNQPRSKSESSDAVVDIQGSPGNNNFLVWGCNNRSFNIIDQAPSGMNILRRHWHVQRTGNPGAVTLQFDVSGLNVVSPGDLDLIVATNDEFSSSVQRYTGSLSGTTYTFSNITFNDGDYFTLGEGTLSIAFSSNDPGAPNTWEACRGSSVSIDYDGLSTPPGSVRIYTGTNPIST
ncbi:MAG: PA14 domain-containing protein, partial [Saprospiraceae bacterium]|nr:PA14 domain-containing protein [Saprospiraceae bacterium]